MKSTHLFLTLFSGLSIAAYSGVNPSDSSSKLPYRASTSLKNDIIHTRLDVSFDWNKAQMNGKASITAKPYFRPTSKLSLDARGMEIQSVQVYDLSSGKKNGLTPVNSEMLGNNKLASSYVYQNDSLKIELGREFKADEKYLVEISYTARPNELKKGGSDAITEDKGLYFINPKGEDKNKMPQIWTQGETQANSAWFPTVDTPNEKMTDEIYMTVDNKYTTLSNGLLAESKKNSDGTRTDHWKMDLPHSPYLVMMAVGEFKKVTDAPWNGKEVSYYVEKEYEPYAKGIFGETKEMIEFYSKVLETPYPWQKYSQIVVRDYVSGAMENTSATLHGDFMVYQTDREMIDGKKGEDVIAHELFHQWFGDLATAESWSNLPLNESFATYGEYLWEEYKHGRDAADAHHYEARVGYYNEAQQKQVDLIRFHYSKQEDMFDAFSYNKGGQVLHMLRKYVGDAAFFASLKLYLERNRFKSVEIHNLRLAFEEVTGEDLNWFFNEWFLSKGHPQLEITKNYDEANHTLTMNVKQKQDLPENPLYRLPVDVDVYVNGKKERHRIVIDQPDQDFSLACAAKPDLVNFDGERQLLGYKTYNKSDEELIFQYSHAPLYSDRMEALNSLKKKLDNPAVYRLFLDAAEKDAWRDLRIMAMNILNTVAAQKEAELKPLFIRIANTDKNTLARAEAISLLGKSYTGADLEELYKRSLKEQSYAIVSAALAASHDSVAALLNAKSLENEKSEQIFSAVAEVYSKFGSDANVAYFMRSKNLFSNYGYIAYVRSYSEFLKRCNDPASYDSAADIFIDLIKTGNAYVSGYTKDAYKSGILEPLKTRSEQLKEKDPEKAKLLEATRTKLDARLQSVSRS